MASFAGLGALSVACCYLLYALYARLVLNESPAGFTALIFFIVFLSGVQMLFLGLIGEYLGFISVLLAAGLFWSSLDGYRCSLWWKGRVVYAKLAGDIPYVSWDNVRGAVFSRCYKLQPPAQLEDEVQ